MFLYKIVLIKKKCEAGELYTAKKQNKTKLGEGGKMYHCKMVTHFSKYLF